MENKYVIKVIILVLLINLFDILPFVKSVYAIPLIESTFEEERELKSNHKTIYITFDDGPSINNTEKILKILNKYNIKATFFVIGNKAEEYEDVVKKLYDSGMCIASHTYTHEYDKIFTNVENYKVDLEKCNESIKKIVGESPVSYIRIPGGTHNNASNKNNMNGIIEYLKENNINYVGWNVCSNDALGRNIPSYKLFNNVKTQTEKIELKSDIIVLLMHDSYYKKTTVEVLPKIIEYYTNKGYEFKTFNNISREDYDKMINEKLINKEIIKKINK
ncbi:polysaccharide deacetylase family protein [Clostridium sediminicola]|uniref:polysaccharide deacetylase family protein n=1 Tax=Clostridium sediminicola TaxID=3114879 RepID=UPI0031F23D58